MFPWLRNPTLEALSTTKRGSKVLDLWAVTPFKTREDKGLKL